MRKQDEVSVVEPGKLEADSSYPPVIPIVEAVLHDHREVPPSRGAHVRGFHPVRPGHGSVAFESILERDVIARLARFSGVRIVTQPVTVFYKVGGVRYRYTPDILVEFDEVPAELEWLGFEGKTFIECKPGELVRHVRVKLDRDIRALQKATGRPVVLLTDVDLAAGILEARHDG